MAAKNLPDAAYLRECLRLQPRNRRPYVEVAATGSISSVSTSGASGRAARAGNLAGTLTTHGYIKIVLSRRNIYAHPRYLGHANRLMACCRDS